MIISKTELARELRVSKGRVSQMLRCGLPVRADGFIDRDLAVAWYASNVVPHSREALPRRAVGSPPGEPGHAAIPPGGRIIPAVPLPTAQHSGALGAHAAVVDALRRVASSLEILAFGRVALAAGAVPTVAYVLALWHGTAAVMAIDALDDNDVRDFREPTETEWRELLGGDFDFDRAGALYDQVTG